MINKDRESSSRIPIRFVDEDATGGDTEGPDDEAHGGELSPEELGRASSYEGETEMQRRIDRGAEQDTEEGRGRADEADTAGGPEPSELPENREDLDTRASFAGDEIEVEVISADASDREEIGKPRPAGSTGSLVTDASGPLIAELVATRAELRRVETEMQALRDERQDLHDRLARRQADFDNYRKRVERERSETYNGIVGEVVSHLLPVIDNLRRALDAEYSVEANESEEFRHFLHGVELINKQLIAVLGNLGVEPVPTVGQPFDPHVHEAIATEETDQFKSDTVMEEIVRGYRLGDKLLRPAQVKVAK